LRIFIQTEEFQKLHEGLQARLFLPHVIMSHSPDIFSQELNLHSTPLEYEFIQSNREIRDQVQSAMISAINMQTIKKTIIY